MKRLQITLRYVLSFLVIGFFLMITTATNVFNLLLISSNVTVAIENCEAKPPVIGTLEINMLALDSLGNGIPGVTGRLFIVHQKVNSDTCKFDVVFNVTHTFETDANGLASYTGPDWLHDNSQDLWRVEIDWNFSYNISPKRLVQVKYYSQSEFFFTGIQNKLKPL